MGRQEGIAGHVWSHRAVTQDEMRQDGEYSFTRRTLEPPDSEPTQPNTDIVRVTGQAPTATTGRLVCQLKAQGQEKGEDAFDKGLAITKQLRVGRFVLKINGDGPVCAWLFGCVTHVPPRLSSLCYA
jgi:hypothetical protein